MISTLIIHWKDLFWNWSSNTLATWCEELTHLKRSWCWERQKAGKEGDDRRRDGWMASLTQWTWVCASSRRWWRTGKSGLLQSMGSQTVRHDWATEQQRSLLPQEITYRSLIKLQEQTNSIKKKQKKGAIYSLIYCFVFYFIFYLFILVGG